MTVRREAGAISDLRHPGTGTPVMLKPGAFAAMTEVPRVAGHRLKKSRRYKGLPRHRRRGYREEDETGRNLCEGRKTRLSSINQIGIDAMPMRRWAHLIATNDDMDATDLEIRRLRYDYRLSEHFRAADAKVQANQRVAGLSTANPSPPLHMRQSDSEASTLKNLYWILSFHQLRRWGW